MAETAASMVSPPTVNATDGYWIGERSPAAV
jgi:hypothetical protein